MRLRRSIGSLVSMTLALAVVASACGSGGSARATEGPVPAPKPSPTTSGTEPPAQGGSPPLQWVIDATALMKLRDLDSGLVDQRLGEGSTFVLQKPYAEPGGYGIPVARYQSFAAFQQDVIRDHINPEVHWVIYDNERWPLTPADEQADPAGFEQRFTALAHSHGYRVILAPALDLSIGTSHTGSIGAGYVQAGFPAFSAIGDVYVIQAQMYEGSPIYEAFVRQVAAQALQARPGLTVLAGVSTARVEDASQIAGDIESTRQIVAGYWLNLPGQPNPSGQPPATVAADALRMVA